MASQPKCNSCEVQTPHQCIWHATKCIEWSMMSNVTFVSPAPMGTMTSSMYCVIVPRQLRGQWWLRLFRWLWWWRTWQEKDPQAVAAIVLGKRVKQRLCKGGLDKGPMYHECLLLANNWAGIGHTCPTTPIISWVRQRSKSGTMSVCCLQTIGQALDIPGQWLHQWQGQAQCQECNAQEIQSEIPGCHGWALFCELLICTFLLVSALGDIVSGCFGLKWLSDATTQTLTWTITDGSALLQSKAASQHFLTKTWTNSSSLSAILDPRHPSRTFSVLPEDSWTLAFTHRIALTAPHWCFSQLFVQARLLRVALHGY